MSSINNIDSSTMDSQPIEDTNNVSNDQNEIPASDQSWTKENTAMLNSMIKELTDSMKQDEEASRQHRKEDFALSQGK